jgi:hypothetical protein
MKPAIGLMACIAIAFLWITSPESSKSHASKDSENRSIVQTSSAANYDQLKSELDAKLDGLLESIQKDTADLSGKLRSTVESDLDRIDALEKKLDEIDKKLVAGTLRVPSAASSSSPSSVEASTPKSIGPSVKSIPNASANTATTTILKSANTADGTRSVPATYTARWQNYDGLSPREHAEVMHGINTAGLTDAQIALMRDRDHDIYGAGHPEAMRAANQAATSTRIPSSVTYSSNVSYSPPSAARSRSASTNVSYNSVPAAKSQPKVSSRPRLFSRWRSCPPGGCPN